MSLATVNPDTRNTATSGSTVNDRFNDLVAYVDLPEKFKAAS